MKSLRLTKLIDRKLQLKMSVFFVCAVAFALLFQFVLLTSRMTGLAEELGDAGADATDRMMKLLPETLFLSLGVILPLTMVLGILATFRVAGPLYACRRHLEELVRGEAKGPLRLRNGDALQDLAELLNKATEPLLATESGKPAAGTEQGERDAA